MFTLESRGAAAIFTSAGKRLRIGFPTPAIAGIAYTEDRDFQRRPSRIVTAAECYCGFDLREDAEAFLLSTSELTVALDKGSGALSYREGAGQPLTAGRLLTEEPRRGGKWLTSKPIDRKIFAPDAAVAFAPSIDGVRATAAKYETVFDRNAFEAKLEFVFSPGEARPGLPRGGLRQSPRPSARALPAEHEGGRALLRLYSRIWAPCWTAAR